MMALATDLDWLQRMIEENGSVVPKQPDVWGQARLTKHRQEFENVMKGQLTEFKPSLQGALSRSDQAYFANAMALSAAASGAPAVLTPTSETLVTAEQKSAQIQPKDLGDPKDLVSDLEKDKVFERTKVLQARQATFGGDTAAVKLSLEPSILLDQQKRYLDHLNEIRRANEGDDTADSPGYALHLVRMPVSVLPGRVTDKGYGAEITATITPDITPELLPMTFRSLVINDVIDQIAFPLTKIINSEEDRKRLTGADPKAQAKTQALRALMIRVKSDKPATFCALRQLKEYLDLEESLKAQVDSLASREYCDAEATAKRTRVPSPSLEFILENYSNDELQKAIRDQQPLTQLLPNTDLQLKALSAQNRKMLVQNWLVKQEIAKNLPPAIEGIVAKLEATTANLAATTNIQLSASRNRTARFALPPSQINCVIGDEYLLQIGQAVLKRCEAELKEGKVIHLPDVQNLLNDEVIAAYEFLRAKEGEALWSHCTQPLAQAVRRNDLATVATLRGNFATAARAGRCLPNCEDPQGFLEALAWCIVVESALLNDHLVNDLREVAIAKNSGPLQAFAGQWLDFYAPNPSPQAREAFCAYVRVRWPIHVFALDPITQDQNIADRYSARREMQLALSLAFVSGNISARNFTRYARRIEIDMDTIDLNRTAVGFSHGTDTFGWRFYPRFQSPDIESNSTVLFRDLLCGGPSRDALLRQRRLEPGPRECVALVIMPSFVPYATIETTSNWFMLTNPKQKQMDHRDAMRLSRTVKSIENCAGQVQDAQCYRDGEWQRLWQRVKQLEHRLPTQTLKFQVPYENTLGGFEMFSNGVTDLAPELLGFYGEPGIKAKGLTTLFLVGNHFSVHETKVIVGGKAIEAKLLSRQVMQVDIFNDEKDPITKVNDKVVDVHVATPYGVSRHLEIPLIPETRSAESKKGSGYAWEEPPSFVARVQYDECGRVKNFCFETAPKELKIKDNTNTPPAFRDAEGELVVAFAGETEDKSVLQLPGTTRIVMVGKDKKVDVRKLSCAIIDKLKGEISQSQGLVKVEGTAIIRFKNDALPTFPLDNKLSIKVLPANPTLPSSSAVPPVPATSPLTATTPMPASLKKPTPAEEALPPPRPKPPE